MTLPIDGIEPKLQKDFIKMQFMDRESSENEIVDFLFQQSHLSKTTKKQETND